MRFCSSWSRLFWLLGVPWDSIWILGWIFLFLKKLSLEFWQGLHWICRSLWRPLNMLPSNPGAWDEFPLISIVLGFFQQCLVGKDLLPVQGTWVWPLDGEYSLEKDMATCYSTLAWEGTFYAFRYWREWNCFCSCHFTLCVEMKLTFVLTLYPAIVLRSESSNHFPVESLGFFCVWNHVICNQG